MTGDRILLSGPNLIYELRRSEDDKLSTEQDIDFSDLLGTSGQLLSVLYDAVGNLWFTTGGSAGAGFEIASNDSTIGYLTPDGTRETLVLESQVIENSIAMNDGVVYAFTGPAGEAANGPSAGFFYAVQASSNGVQTLFREEYNAGSGLKDGGFSRGSGSSPNLLGNEYIAIRDNADDQVNLLVFKQATDSTDPATTTDSATAGKGSVCSIPLFNSGTSAFEATFVSHFDETNYALVATNCYKYPTIYFDNRELPIDRDWNKPTAMGAGLTRIDVEPQVDGPVKCSVRWHNQESKTSSIATLSTKTGPLYNYYQDLELAEQGEYVWYMVAMNWETGEEVWRVMTGTGGGFDNNFQTPTIAPDGCLWIAVAEGVVKICDGDVV
ncbi:hypothetical protein Slin15195_G060270 [Septoria linicola]|uniref:Uncharacterized protein n=1 Tax=Septoria linicola TaxID=215465 RepID=A0A9Q9AV76_9PEZI|nr:hypothetical protein Slin15195_G060270 [Septoria linicola]